jgi:hypothetical protein
MRLLEQAGRPVGVIERAPGGDRFRTISEEWHAFRRRAGRFGWVLGFWRPYEAEPELRYHPRSVLPGGRLVLAGGPGYHVRGSLLRADWRMTARLRGQIGRIAFRTDDRVADHTKNFRFGDQAAQRTAVARGDARRQRGDPHRRSEVRLHPGPAHAAVVNETKRRSTATSPRRVRAPLRLVRVDEWGPASASRSVLKSAAAAGLLLLGLSFVPDAQALTRCAYSGAPTNLLTVTTTGEVAEGVIERLGEQIVVGEGRPRPCSGGVPTVLNTDRIRVVMRGLAVGVALRLGGGPFAPGATPEAEGASEIEIEFSGRTTSGSVVGTPRADEFHWAPAGAQPGVNLNPGSANDQDADVTITGSPLTALTARGAAGNDTIIPAPMR